MNCNCKLFYYSAITTTLLWGWWSVQGENSDELLTAAELESLKRIQDPALYHDLREQWIVSKLKRDVDHFKKQYKEEKEKGLADRDTARKFIEAIQGIKMRDWIIEVEKEFPVWLSDLAVDRYIKWTLALYFVNTPTFIELQTRLKKLGMEKKDFANEIYRIYEDSSAVIAHNLPGVPIPRNDDITKVCQIISAGKDGRQSACEVLLNVINVNKLTVSDPSNKQPPSATSDTHPTKFYILITKYTKKEWNAEIGYNDVVNGIEKNEQFIKHDCRILEQMILDRCASDNTFFGQKEKMTLPTIVIQVGFPLNLLGVSPADLKKNKSILDSVQASIKADLKNALNEQKSEGNIIIQDEFISYEWARSFRPIEVDPKGARQNQ